MESNQQVEGLALAMNGAVMLINKLRLITQLCRAVIWLLAIGMLIFVGVLLKDRPWKWAAPLSPESAARAESIARDMIKEKMANPSRVWTDSDLRNRFAEIGSSQAPMRGFFPFLSDSSAEIRQIAAEYLGQLNDRGARGPLVQALQDPAVEVRFAVCQALNGMYPEDADKIPLRRLLQFDPDPKVRVAAAGALGWPTDDIALAAYKVGLNIDRFRGECEDVLEKAGKLELPLPEGCYQFESREMYESRLKSGRNIFRVARKNGQLFYEVGEPVCVRRDGAYVMMPRCAWYKTMDTGQ